MERIVFFGAEPESLAGRLVRACSRLSGVRAEVTLRFPLAIVSLHPDRGGRTAVRSAARALCSGFEKNLVSTDGIDPAGTVIAALARRGLTLATAESCTGGLVSHMLTSVPGASSVLRLGVVAYANEAKTGVLGVRPVTLERHGAVSRPTALAMLAGALSAGSCDCAVATTGIAGPSGGTRTKPLGLVFVGAAVPGARRVVRRRFEGRSREGFLALASTEALMLLLALIGESGRQS